jgi:hypothetical protein
MADFSKQWCDVNDLDMSYDFDILEVFGKLKDGSEFFTNLPNYPDLIDKLQENQIIIEVQPLVSKSEKNLEIRI